MDRFKRFRAYARAWATGDIQDGTHDNDIVAAAIGARAKLAESKLMTIQELDITIDSLGISADEEADDDAPDVGSGAHDDVRMTDRDEREQTEARARLQGLILAGGQTDTGGRWLFDAAADEIVRLRKEVDAAERRSLHAECAYGGELRQAREALEQARAKVDDLRETAERLSHQHQRDEDRLRDLARRNGDACREQGAAEMRERAADAVKRRSERSPRDGALADLEREIRTLPLDGAPTAAPSDSQAAKRKHAEVRDLTADERDTLRRDGWAGGGLAYWSKAGCASLAEDDEDHRSRLIAIASMARAAPSDGLSHEDAETLRVSTFWTEIGPGVWERWGRPGVRWREDCTADLVGLRAAARQHRRDVAPPVTHGEPGKATGGDRATGGTSSLAEEQGAAQGAPLCLGCGAARGPAASPHACSPSVAALPKPARVEVGQRWAFDGRKVAIDLRPARVVHVDAKWADASGPHGQWSAYPSDMLADPRWTFLGTMPQEPKPWRGLVHEVGAHRTDLDTWVVEAVDHASEGEIYAAHFSGQFAEERAREYAGLVSATTPQDPSPKRDGESEEEHQCGGPREARMEPGCDECGTPAEMRDASDIAREMVEARSEGETFWLGDRKESIVLSHRFSDMSQGVDCVRRIVARFIDRGRAEGKRAAVELAMTDEAEAGALSRLRAEMHGTPEPTDHEERSVSRWSRACAALNEKRAPFDRGYLYGMRDAFRVAEGAMRTVEAPRAEEAPSGMRIEKREDGEWLVGSPEILSDCGEVRDERPCHYHLSGQHISTSISRTDKDGAEFIVARWPIAAPAREDEPSDLEKVAAMQADLSAGLRDGIARMLKDGEVMTSADERVTLIVRGGVDADDVFKACAELLDMPSESAELVRVAGLASDLSFAYGVEEGKRQRQEYGLAAIGDLAKMQERDAAWTRITGAVDPEQARDALLSTGRGAIERAHAEGVTEGERRAKVKAAELATSWDAREANYKNLSDSYDKHGRTDLHHRYYGRRAGVGACIMGLRAAFDVEPTDPGKPPTGEPVPDATGVVPEGGTTDLAASAVDVERIARLERVYDAAFAWAAGVSGADARLREAVRVPWQSAPVMPGQSTAEERAAFAAGDAGSFIPHSEVMAGVCERAHADGITEGLRRAREAARRLSDGDRLGAVDVAAMIEAIDACSAGVVPVVATADATPPVAPDREALGREVHAASGTICGTAVSWDDLGNSSREWRMAAGERLFNMGVRYAQSHAIPRLFPVTPGPLAELSDRIEGVIVQAFSEDGDGERRGPAAARWILRLVDEHLQSSASTTAAPAQDPALEALRELAVSFRRNEAMAAARVDKHPDGTRGEPFHDGRRIAFAYCVKALCCVAGIEPPPSPPPTPSDPQGTPGPEAQDGSAVDHGKGPTVRSTIDGGDNFTAAVARGARVAPPVEASPLFGVYADIFAERMAQDRKWGGPDHDDGHDASEWLDFIRERAGMADEVPGGPDGDAEYRRRMVQIAALAVAAVESLDRHLSPPARPSATDDEVARANAGPRAFVDPGASTEGMEPVKPSHNAEQGALSEALERAKAVLHEAAAHAVGPRTYAGVDLGTGPAEAAAVVDGPALVAPVVVAEGERGRRSATLANAFALPDEGAADRWSAAALNRPDAHSPLSPAPSTAPAAVTPSQGPRIELRDGAEVTVDSPELSACDAMSPDVERMCTVHIDGHHVSEGAKVGPGSWLVKARWPIAPTSPETCAQCDGSGEVNGWRYVGPVDPQWEPGAIWEHHGQRRTLMESQRQHDPPRAYFRELGWLEGHRRADMTEVNGWRYVGKE